MTSPEMRELDKWKGTLRNTASNFTFRCWQNFNKPHAYYWLRISYQNHAKLYEGQRRKD